MEQCLARLCIFQDQNRNFCQLFPVHRMKTAKDLSRLTGRIGSNGAVLSFINNQRCSLLNFNNRHYCSKQNKTEGWPTWKGIITKFLPIGLCFVAVMQWRTYRKYSSQQIASSWQISAYSALPLRIVSRFWGWIADKNLPEFMRPYVYGLYASTFGVNLMEVENQDFKSYPSLTDFFTRALKEGAREINYDSCLVAPCDGTVLHYGPVKTCQIEQVKGVTYSLEKFLGENTWSKGSNHDYLNNLLCQKDRSNNLYHCVIYLAPGDYHRFHSPTAWQPTHRRHFPGKLLSVNPKIVRWLPGLFCLNERAVYLGQWKHGFFSMTAVGATNVGSIRIYCDKILQTNQPKYKHHYISKDKCLGSNIELKRGELFGEFRMGSTIVLIFEAPKNFYFNLSPGQRVKMGQSICCGYQEKNLSSVS